MPVFLLIDPLQDDEKSVFRNLHFFLGQIKSGLFPALFGFNNKILDR